MSQLSSEEKQRILKALEEDREFRYAIAGILGLREIIERLDSVKETVNQILMRIEEQNKVLMEHTKVLKEHSQTLAEHSKRLEELAKRIEEQNKVLMEHTKVLKEHSKRLEEHSDALKELSNNIIKLKRIIMAVAARWGVSSEDAFRNAVKSILGDILRVKGLKVERWTYFDKEGVVYGRESIVEIDVVIRNDTHILIEIKSSASRGDILELVRIKELYKRVVGVEPKLVMVTPFIDKRALELARRLNVEVYTIDEG